MIQEKINSKVDTTAIEQEIAAAEKQLQQYYSIKSKIMEEIDTLDPDERHYIIRKSDLDERLYRMYDKIEEAENNLMDARQRSRLSKRIKSRAITFTKFSSALKSSTM